MKNKRLVKWIALAVTAIAVGLGSFGLYQAQFVTLDMSFATSVILKCEDTEIILTPEEAEAIKDAFTGKMKKEPLSGCGFGFHQIRFIGKEKEITVYPGMDHCGNTALGINGEYDENGVFFSIGKEGNNCLWSIAQKYGCN